MGSRSAGQIDDVDDAGRQTLGYYERNAKAYSNATLDRDLSSTYGKFLRRLKCNARILDAGSGSGRDCRAFRDLGYDVTGFDASSELCRLSRRLTDAPIRHLPFQEFDEREQYEGIWACASLLHVPKRQLADAVGRLVRGLRAGGVMYMSFKDGSGERVAQDGRFYSDLTADDLRALVCGIPGIDITDLWTSKGRDGAGRTTVWQNVLVKKDARLGAG